MAKTGRFKKFALGTLGVLALLVVVVGGVTYSWTFTPMGRLDYQAAVISKLASWNSGPMEISPEARAQMRAMAGPGDDSLLAEGVRYEDQSIERADGTLLPVRIYWPMTDGDAPLPLYLDIHGGAWWAGDGYPLHIRYSELAAAAGAIVVAVEYRLVPEHVHPAQLEDCDLALKWMHANAASLGGDPARIAIGGGSAGGQLAAALAIKTRDEGGPNIAFQFLHVPATDLSDTHEWDSFAQTGENYMLTVSGIHQVINAYVPDPQERLNPLVSPLLAKDLSNLPPALIVTAQFDPLRDQGEAYGRALAAAGVDVALHREPGAIHGLMGSPDRMDRVYAMAAAALRSAYSDEQ